MAKIFLESINHYAKDYTSCPSEMCDKFVNSVSDESNERIKGITEIREESSVAFFWCLKCMFILLNSCCSAAVTSTY